MSADKSRKPFEDIRIGDQVRLKSDAGKGFEWTVVGRSFGSMTFDITSGDPNDRGRILHGVRAALLEKIEAA